MNACRHMIHLVRGVSCVYLNRGRITRADMCSTICSGVSVIAFVLAVVMLVMLAVGFSVSAGTRCATSLVGGGIVGMLQ